MKLLSFLFLILSTASGMPGDDRINEACRYLNASGSSSDHVLLIDLSVPSNEKRLFVIDKTSKKVLYTTYVAHGKGSGTGTMATVFNDTPGGLCSTLGHFRIGKSYIGKHGLSYALLGLDPTNRNAEDRSIVIHSAWYATPDFIKANGRCGNSWGCPAVSEQALKDLKPFLQEGTIVWIYQ